MRNSRVFMKATITLACMLGCFVQNEIHAQLKQTQFNGFGHLEYTLEHEDSTNSYFSIGEHDFFITSNLSNRISFLGEYVIRFNQATSYFRPSIERSFMRFNYTNNHNIIAGKIHTPDARGVGLFLTKNQVEAMGGRIEVKSVVDEGTVFSVFLPTQIQTE